MNSQSLKGLVPSVISSALVTPSPSQSAVEVITVVMSKILNSQSLFASVLSLTVNGSPSVPFISSAFVTPSPSQSPVLVAGIVTWVKSKLQSSNGFVSSPEFGVPSGPFISSPFVTPSPSQSFASQVASGVSVALAKLNSQGLVGSVLSVVSCPFVTPSPSQSLAGSLRSHEITVMNIVSVTQIAGKGVPSSQIVTIAVSKPTKPVFGV